MNAHLGNLYEINQSAYTREPSMTREAVEEKKKEIANYFQNHSNTYFMLLCNERKDYTVIKLNHSNNQCAEDAAAAIIECLSNRGEIVEIEKQDNGAYECWIKRSKLAHMYALFPYDAAVIEC